MNWLQSQAMNLILPMVLGPLVYVIVKALKDGSYWIDKQGPATKRTLVVAVALLVTAGMQLAGQPISCDVGAANASDCLGQITPEILKALLGSGVAFAMHYLKKSPPNA